MGNYNLSGLALAIAAVAVFSVAVGVVVLRRERRSRAGLALFALSLTIGVWLGASALVCSAADASTAIFWAHVEYIAVPFVPVAIYVYVSVGLRLYARQKVAIWVVGLVALAFTGFAHATDLLLGGVREHWWGYYPFYGPAGLLFVGYFGLLIGLGAFQLTTKLRETASGSPFRGRIRLTLAAFIIISVAAIDFVPKFGGGAHPFGFVAVFGFLVTVLVLERRHRVVYMSPAFAAGEILATMQNAVLVADREGRVEMANRSAGLLLGYGDDALHSLSLGQILEPGAESEALAGSCLAGASIRDRAMGWVRKDGETVEVSMSASPLLDQRGQPLGVVLAALDMTERRAAEAARAEAEERYRVLAESTRDAIFSCDNEFRVTGMNRAAAEALCSTAESALGKHMDHLGFPEQTLALWKSMAIRVVSEGAEVREMSTATMPDGRLHTYEVTLAPIRDLEDKCVGFRGHARDVTEQERAREALERSEEQLAQSQKMEAVGQLAGGIAHDFNNLLTAILGYAELLLSDDEIAGMPQKNDVEEIKHAAERAGSLTRQILAFSRRQALRPEVIRLDVVVSRMQSLLERTLGEDVDLVVRSGPDLGAVEVDPHQFEQVVLNLALNARDAMPSGGCLTLETANVELDESYCCDHPDAQPGRCVVLSVSDTGVGMDEKTKARVFEPFFTTKAPGEGTGLGLSTVYGVVRQSGGSVSVYSEPGRGSTFKVYLPQAVAPETQARSREIDVPPLTVNEGTILLVEDEKAIRDLASRVLTRLGYRVLVAADGTEAVQIVEAQCDAIDILVTDVVLPGRLQGTDLVSHATERRPGLPVVFMSGYTRDAIVHAGRLDEGVNFLGKPFTPDALAAKVRDVLATARTPA